ncbi:MAG: response regulator [Nitrospiria bacterium]
MENRLLVVEDNPGYLALLKIRLEKAGFSVEPAEGGEAAKQRFTKSPTPLVITDLAMPNVDGIALLRFIKAHRPETKVILLTGKGSIEKAVQAMQEGADDFLIKPVSEAKLIDLVHYCFKTLQEKGNGAQQSLEDRLMPYALTKSELGVVELVLQGKQDQEIADTLCISYHTVKKHLQNLYKKIKVKNRVDLIIQFK